MEKIESRWIEDESEKNTKLKIIFYILFISSSFFIFF